ncbi:hypothetical protein ABPG72_021044 [Tetrahymena utriculariae]
MESLLKEKKEKFISLKNKNKFLLINQHQAFSANSKVGMIGIDALCIGKDSEFLQAVQNTNKTGGLTQHVQDLIGIISKVNLEIVISKQINIYFYELIYYYRLFYYFLSHAKT